MADKIIDVNRTHPTYDKMKLRWQFYMDSYKGGRDYVRPIEQVSLTKWGAEGSYLFPHDIEYTQPWKFQRRHLRSYYDNWCARPVDTMTKYLFGNMFPIVREYNMADKGFEGYINNIDNMGTGIDQFMRRAATMSLVCGISYILVDKTNASEDFVVNTLEQERLAGMRAYASILGPLAVKNWSIDQKTGGYNWVLISSQILNNSDYTKPAEWQWVYYLWTKDEIYYLDRDGQNIESPVKNQLGKIPLVACPYSDMDQDGITESFLRTIADINRSIYNLDSLYDEECYKLAFAQILMQASKDDWTEQNPGQAKTLTLSVDEAIQYPADSAAPHYLEFPVSALQEKRARKNELILDILRLSGMGDQSAVSSSMASGLAMSFAYSDMYTNVSQLANRMERYEQKMWDYIQMWDSPQEGGRLVEGKIVVYYPSKFDVRLETEKRENYKTGKAELKNSPTALTLLDMAFGVETYQWEPDEQRKIEAELTAGYATNVATEQSLEQILTSQTARNQATQITETDTEEDETKVGRFIPPPAKL